MFSWLDLRRRGACWAIGIPALSLLEGQMEWELRGEENVERVWESMVESAGTKGRIEGSGE